MAANKKDGGVIFRCPACMGGLVDGIIDQYDDGMYRCVKCGFSATPDEMKDRYAAFRGRYQLIATRIPLEVQRTM